jgi:putative transposase
VDLIRESVRLVMQELIEAEASEMIAAGRYERTETRVTGRSGRSSLNSSARVTPALP